MNTDIPRPRRDAAAFAERLQLIGEVENGQITPKDAEAKALELGLGPLASMPAPEAFDPMRLDRWTPCMALAWILWRSADKVREGWKEYTEECWGWVFREHRLGFDGETREGHFLEQVSHATLSRLEFDVSWDESMASDRFPCTHLKSFSDARSEMWAMLARGSLRSSGVNRATGERSEIPASLWPDLDAVEEHGAEVFCGMKRFPHGTVFEDVQLDASRVRELWLPALDQSDREPPLVTPATGYIPLSAAAHWVATEGGTVDVTNEALREAYRPLLQGLVDGDIQAIGVHDGLPEPIPGYVFTSCRVRHPSDALDDALVLSETLALVCHSYFNDALWQSGFDDSLRNWNGTRWRRISVKSRDLIGVFEHLADKQGAYENPSRTGSAGRPGSYRLVLREHSARLARGEVRSTLIAEAKELESWLTATHGENAAAMTANSIANKIRADYNGSKGKRPFNSK